MKMNLFIMIAAILAAVVGLGLLMVPVLILSLYGIDLSQNLPGQFLARYCGSAFLGFAMLLWRGQNAKSEAEWVTASLLGGLVVNVTGLLVSIWAGLVGAASNFIWINTIIYGFLTIGFGYFYLQKSK